MKKLLSILLALSLTLSLAACGDKDDDKEKETNKRQETKFDKDDDKDNDKDNDKDEKKSKKVDIDDAVWEGYDDMPLTDLIDEALGSMSSFGIDYKVSSKKGWSKSQDLDEGDLSKGLEPYTYTISMEYDGMTETVYLFMALDEDGVLSAHGAAANEDGDFEERGARDAEDLLQEFVDMIESDYDDSFDDYDDSYDDYDDDYDFDADYDFDDFDYEEFDFEDYDY